MSMKFAQKLFSLALCLSFCACAASAACESVKNKHTSCGIVRKNSSYQSSNPSRNRSRSMRPDLSYAVAGGLSYAMTLDEMTDAIKSKLDFLYCKGKIITREQFKKYDKNKWFFKKDNLTRIWGAEYLADHFAQNKKHGYKVPDYIIVVDDLKKVQIKVFFWPYFPAFARIKGAIYAQKINGSPAADADVGFGFTDYTGPNILKDTKGDYYVIDTEYRSFYHAAPEADIFKHIKNWKSKAEHLKTTFLTRHGIKAEDKLFTFSLS